MQGFKLKTSLNFVFTLVLAMLFMSSLQGINLDSNSYSDFSAPVSSTINISDSGLETSYNTVPVFEEGVNYSAKDSSIQPYIQGKNPVYLKVYLENNSNDSNFVGRLNPLGIKGIQAWAYNENDGLWYDINKVGLEPKHNFNLSRGYSDTTPIYLLSNSSGTYSGTISLVNLTDSNNSIVSQKNITFSFENSRIYVQKNCSDQYNGLCFNSIQSALDSASYKGIVNVGSGIFNGDVSINNRTDLVGNGIDSIINGTVNIASSYVNIEKLKITNPNGYGIYSLDNGNLKILSNKIYNVKEAGIYVKSLRADTNMIDIENNVISGVLSGNESSKGIYAGDSTGSRIYYGLTIKNNSISNVSSSQGAYGILVNHWNWESSSNPLKIIGNSLSELKGLWVHAIGLEGNTPGALIGENKIYDLNTSLVAINFEDNVGEEKVSIYNNSFSLGNNSLHILKKIPDFLEYNFSGQVLKSNNSLNDSKVLAFLTSGTYVYSLNSSWNGAINPPTEESYSGKTPGNLIEAYEIGFPGVLLNLSEAAKIIFKNMSGEKIGYTHGWDGFNEISLCSNARADISWANLNLASGSECYIRSGQDLVVFTKHLTDFVIYNVDSSSDSTSLAGGGGGTCTTQWDCSSWSSCVNGIQTRTCSYPNNFCTPKEDEPPLSQKCDKAPGDEQNSSNRTNSGTNASGANSQSLLTGFAISAENAAGSPYGVGALFILLVLGAFGYFVKTKKNKVSESKKGKTDSKK